VTAAEEEDLAGIVVWAPPPSPKLHAGALPPPEAAKDEDLGVATLGVAGSLLSMLPPKEEDSHDASHHAVLLAAAAPKEAPRVEDKSDDSTAVAPEKDVDVTTACSVAPVPEAPDFDVSTACSVAIAVANDCSPKAKDCTPKANDSSPKSKDCTPKRDPEVGDVATSTKLMFSRRRSRRATAAGDRVGIDAKQPKPAERPHRQVE
jgi:hypothetical protein